MEREYNDKQRLVRKDAFPVGDSAETASSPGDLTVNYSNENTFNLKIKHVSRAKDHGKYTKRAWTKSARVYKVL
jgi:hypothetical protein